MEIDAIQTGLKKNSFDVIISCELIEHLPDVMAHLEEVKRLLKTGGYYFMTTPNHNLELMYDFIFNKKADELHVSPQTHNSLGKVLKDAGFKVNFYKLNTLTVGQKDKLGFLHRLYPVKFFL